VKSSALENDNARRKRMANVQSQFDEFHNRIKLGRFDENQTLRDKRNIIRRKLEENLPKVFEKYGELCPTFRFRDQGSYEMGTGIKPLDGDFDIDQGLYFVVSTKTYSDPVVLKERVYEALEGHTKRVEIRRPCVTVFYQREGESIYHVDIAVYSDASANPDGKSYLAKGKKNSDTAYRIWEVSNPQALSDTIFDRFKENDRAQFRRVVRYLKRWRDVNFPSNGHAAPLGIGMTVATYDHLQPTYTDVVAGTPDDLSALRTVTDALLNRFMSKWDDANGQWARRLTVILPVEPWSDLFAQVTNSQMSQLEERLKELAAALKEAAADADPHEACQTLQTVFGKDFPVPEKVATARRHPPAIVSSSSSA
jgi:cyclic GMP-AMP synthase DncV-like protein